MVCREAIWLSSEHGLWSRAAGVQIPALLVTSCVTLGKSLKCSVSQFPSLSSGDSNSANLGKLNELIHVILRIVFGTLSALCVYRWMDRG